MFTAVALGGILEQLLAAGTVLVVTSNRAPGELNSDGMQRELFKRYAGTLERQCEPWRVASEHDYRRLAASMDREAEGGGGGGGEGGLGDSPPAGRYLHPLGPAADAELESLWDAATGAGSHRTWNAAPTAPSAPAPPEFLPRHPRRPPFLLSLNAPARATPQAERRTSPRPWTSCSGGPSPCCGVIFQRVLPDSGSRTCAGARSARPTT